ncbi:MAG: phosphopyruvate hydratase, partial [Nitrososphaerales archaeon]
SRGKYEAFELRDASDKTRYRGLGVRQAVSRVNEKISALLTGVDVTSQREIDLMMIELDGTEHKSNLGGNSTVATSLAVAKAAANSLSVPLYRYIGGSNASVLPVPMFLYICGGKLAATDLVFQEFNAMPIGAKSFSEAMRMGSEVYHILGEMLAKKYSKYSLNTGDEGSFSPPGLKEPAEAYGIIMSAIEEAGYKDDFILAMDAAASHFYNAKTGNYNYLEKELSREQLMDLYESLTKSFPLKSIEDPFNEDDFEGFAQITRRLPIQIVGDDLFVTNVSRISKGVEMGAANCLLFKVNQVGTLTESLESASYCFRHGYSVLVSERSGQTEDNWLADIAVAINAGQIKNGAPARSERVAQFNQLLRIEEELGASGKYAGRNFRFPN